MDINILAQFSLKDRVIIVTGGTGILGQSFVKAIASAGAKVAILGRDAKRGQERIEEVKSLGGEAIFVPANVLDAESLISARKVILDKWGTIDGLINAAGGNVPNGTIGPNDNLFDSDISGTFDAIDLNIKGTMLPTHIFGKVIAEKGIGSIINIASLSSKVALTRVLGYTVAKSGIVGYTKWMATELSLRYGDGVRVNAIAPGVFLTEQNRSLLTQSDGSFTARGQQFIQNTPARRLGSPEELGGIIVFLLSAASSFVNGETIYVDGGFSAWSGV